MVLVKILIANNSPNDRQFKGRVALKNGSWFSWHIIKVCVANFKVLAQKVSVPSRFCCRQKTLAFLNFTSGRHLATLLCMVSVLRHRRNGSSWSANEKVALSYMNRPLLQHHHLVRVLIYAWRK